MDNAQIIMEGVKAGIQRRSKERDQSQEDVRLKQQKDYQDALIKQAHDQLDQSKAQFDANHAILAQTAAAKLLEAKAAITQNLAQGLPVPGVQVTPGMDTLGNIMPMGGARAVQQNVTLPKDLGGDQFTMPTPIELAKTQASIQQTLDRPKVEAKMEEARALQKDLLDKQEAGKKADAERALVRAMYDEQIHAADRASQERIAKGSQDTQRFIALHKNALPEGWENYNTTPHIADAMSGTLSREDFSKMQLPPAVKQGIEMGVKSAGGNFLDKKQQEAIGDYGNIQDVIGTMDKLLDILPKNDSNSRVSTTVSGLGEINNRDITDLKERLKGVAPAIGRAVNKDNRISDYDAKAIAEGYFPDVYNKYSNNVSRREDFVKKVNNSIDAKLVGVSQQQRQEIKHRLGLDKIVPYQLKQGTAVPQAPTQYSPEAIQLMKQHGIPIPGVN